MPPIRPPLKRSIDSIQSDGEIMTVRFNQPDSGHQSNISDPPEMIPCPKESDKKYFQIDPTKVYLKITDIARKNNNVFDLTILSWLFPKEEGAKIPHSSIICHGDEISYSKSGIIRKKFSGHFSEESITSLIEFRNVLDRSEYDLEYFLDQCKDRFNAKNYSLFKNNCNHFSFKMLHYFGNDTERLTNLPAYQYKVRDRAATGAAAAAGVGAIGAGTVAIMSSEAAFWTIMNVAGGPVGATVATTVVGSAIAYLSRKIIRKRSSQGEETSSSQSSSQEEPIPGFDNF